MDKTPTLVSKATRQAKIDRSTWALFVDSIKKQTVKNSPLALSWEAFRYGLYIGELRGRFRK